MAGSLYSNPHSLHGDLVGDRSSMAAEQEARRLVLGMCNASEERYTCIFTSGATGAYPYVVQATTHEHGCSPVGGCCCVVGSCSE